MAKEAGARSDGDAAQTEGTFRAKWSNHPDLAFRLTQDPASEVTQWILGRNGLASTDALRALLSKCERILDAGCGNGRVTALLRTYGPPEAEVVGLDLVAADIARENLAGSANVLIAQADLLEDLTPFGTFDFIYCQEVLHHTADPRAAFKNLCTALRPGGEIAIYVYKRKAPAREFVDDYIRSRIADLPYESAFEMCRQITAFGKALAEAQIVVSVPEIDVLEIPAGSYDVQRLFYHFFVKAHWNPALSERDNIAINFDWYHPRLCSRHTVDEIHGWFAESGLTIVHSLSDPYGITVRGRRTSASV